MHKVALKKMPCACSEPFALHANWDFRLRRKQRTHCLPRHLVWLLWHRSVLETKCAPLWMRESWRGRFVLVLPELPLPFRSLPPWKDLISRVHITHTTFVSIPQGYAREWKLSVRAGLHVRFVGRRFFMTLPNQKPFPKMFPIVVISSGIRR